MSEAKVILEAADLAAPDVAEKNWKYKVTPDQSDLVKGFPQYNWCKWLNSLSNDTVMWNWSWLPQSQQS